MFNVTSFTHPTMIAKIREAIKLCVFGQGEKMGGHEHRCYIPNSKGHNFLRIDYRNGQITVLSGWTKASGKRGSARDVTGLVKSALKLVQTTEFGMVNPNMAVCLDNEVACPVRMVTVQ